MALDINDAAARISRMWLKIGRAMERRAFDGASDTMSRMGVIELAKAAEACFWQATGETTATDLKDL